MKENRLNLSEGLCILADKQTISESDMNDFFKQNPDLDLKHIDLFDDFILGTLNWSGVNDKKPSIVAELKKYQRLLRVIDDRAVVRKLLRKNLHSAYHIASLPQSIFIAQYGDLFPDRDTAISAYQRAERISQRLALHRLNLQEQASPYVQATRFLH